MNPELRQTLQNISRNFESANEAAQENIYTFTQLYIDPCIRGFKDCIYDCTSPCFPNREDQVRRRRGHSRGRDQFDFDFYDDWDDEQVDGTGGSGWNNDELDSLLAGRGVGQPRSQRAMSYGSRVRRVDPDTDPTVIPKSSYLGFLDRLPFRIGPKGLRYKPSVAGLQENPGGLRIRDVEGEPLMDDNDHDERDHRGMHRGHTRQRSGTDASRSTATSRSARSDLIMSDEEDDAVPLDEEFAVILAKRTSNSEEQASGKSRRSSSNRRPGASRTSTRTFSNKSLQSHGSNRSRQSSGRGVMARTNIEMPQEESVLAQPSMGDLKREEDELREQEELEIIQKREAAAKLARASGLDSIEPKSPASTAMTESRDPTPIHTPLRQYIRSPPLASPFETTDSEAEPFPEITPAISESRNENDPP